jgi:hypothetical protein
MEERMLNQFDFAKEFHPNPFTIAQIKSFFRKKGCRVAVYTGKNTYTIHYQGKPLARLLFQPDANEWEVEAFLEKSVPVPIEELGSRDFGERLISCRWTLASGLKHLEQALKKAYELR